MRWGLLAQLRQRMHDKQRACEVKAADAQQSLQPSVVTLGVPGKACMPAHGRFSALAQTGHNNGCSAGLSCSGSNGKQAPK